MQNQKTTVGTIWDTDEEIKINSRIKQKAFENNCSLFQICEQAFTQQGELRAAISFNNDNSSLTREALSDLMQLHDIATHWNKLLNRGYIRGSLRGVTWEQAELFGKIVDLRNVSQADTVVSK